MWMTKVTDRQTDRQTTLMWMTKVTDRQTDKTDVDDQVTDKQTDRQTDKTDVDDQGDRQTDRQH